MRWRIALVLGALFVAGAVLSLLNLRPETAPLPEVVLATPSGQPAGLDEFDRRVWVAAFGKAELREDATAAMEAIAGAFPGTPVVLFRPAADGARAVPRGVVSRGVTSGSVAELANGFGLEAIVDRLDDGAVLLTSVDRSGAPRVALAWTADAGADATAPLLDDLRFLRGLEMRPRLHAILNGTSAALLTLGLLFVRKRKIAPHLACMVSAGLVTTAFLVSYLYYHYHAGSVSYPGTGVARAVYFGVLLSHTVLAAFVVPLAVGTYGLAARRRFRGHRALARWTLPIWLYVSITGVVIYWMLYA